MSFDLPQDVQQLPVSQVRQANAQYVEYLPTSSAIGQNFSSGEITIPWSCQSPLWWDPRKSYIRMVINTSFPIPLVVPAGTDTAQGSPFLPYMGVAPSYFQAASLFSRASFSMNGVIVSQISDYMPQIHAFARRILKPDANIKTFEAALDFSDPDFAARQAQVTLETGLQTPTVDTRNTTLGIYDLGIVLPTAAQNVKVTLNAAGTEAVILLSAGALQPDATWAIWRKFVKQGTVMTVQLSAAEGVAWQGVIEQYNVDSGVQVTVTVSNVSGRNGANPIVVGDNNLSANVFFTNVNPVAPVANTYEVFFQPPLSIFETGLMIPGGSFNELKITPYSSSVFQGRGVETLSPKQAGVDFQVVVQQLSLFLYTCAGPRIDSAITWLLPLDCCITCSTQALTSGANSQAQLLFDVPASTYAIGIALQNRNLNDSATSSTKFTVGYPSRSGPLEQSVSRLYVTFRSLTQPAQLQVLEYKQDSSVFGNRNPPDSAGRNFFVKRYMENALVNGLAFNPGGVESFQDFLASGPMFMSYWPGDASSQSSRVTVNITTSEDLTGNTPGSFGANVLLFAVYRQVGTISMEAGRMTSIQVQDL